MKFISFLSVSIVLCLQSFSQPGNNDTSYNSIDTGFGGVYGFNSNVFVVVTQSNGKIIAGGDFTSFNGTSKTRIARLNEDGSLDATFAPTSGANGRVTAIAIQADGKIIIGGQFTTYDGVSRNYIARLNTDGSLDTGFNPGTGFDAPILLNSIAIQNDGKIIIGGSFTYFNGTSRSRIARLNTNGTLDTSFDIAPGFNNTVYAIALQNDGKVIVGGDFTTYKGTTRNRIARLGSDGSIDTSFNPGVGFPTNSVYALAIQADGKIVAGGPFFSYQGISSQHIARINTDGSIDNSFNPGTGFSFAAYSIIVQTNNKLIVTGGFTSFNGTPKGYIARLNSNGSIDANFSTGTGANSIIYAGSIQSDSAGKKIIAGGGFTSFDGDGRNRVARLFLCSNTTFTISPSACYNYTSPGGKFLTSTGTFMDTIPNSTGCDSIITINLSINNSTATISPTGCDSYTSPGGQIWTTTGTFMDTIPNSLGCDSIITVNLTIKNNSVASFSTSVCSSFTSPSGHIWTSTGTYMDTIPNSAGCDSIITVDLTINNSSSSFSASACSSYVSPSGKIWTVSNTYMDTIPNTASCDSIITINLTINNSVATYSASACGSYTSPSGKIWSVSNTYMDTIPNALSCDSVITIYLTVNSLPVITTTQSTNGIVITADETGATYQWIDCADDSIISGETAQTFTATANGNYAVIVSKNGCSDTSLCVSVNSVEVSELTGESTVVKVFPNPNNGGVFMLQTSNGKLGSVQILNLLSDVVYSNHVSNNSTIIDLSQFSSGIYFMRLQSEGHSQTIKLIIK